MANPKHLELARQGRDAWNTWWKENPDEPADFSDTDFTLPENADISFAEFEFSDRASFIGATFGDKSNFFRATFGSWALFDDAAFGSMTLFVETKFGGWALFRRATFGDLTRFDGTIFKGIADFTGVRFNMPPMFSGIEGTKHIILVGVQFRFGRGPLRWTDDQKMITALRYLRGIAEETHATDVERDLFILERMAERGVLWKEWWERSWKSRLLNWQKPFAATIWMFFYSTLSDCGRSTLRPVFWLVAANVGAFFVYARLADNKINDALWSLTFANLLPFGTLAKPLAEHAAVELFRSGVLPPGVGLTAIGQGVVNALLVFLLALALRNHFKVK